MSISQTIRVCRGLRRNAIRGVQSAVLSYDGLVSYMGLGAHLVWLIVIIVVAYLIYKLIKSEKILAPSKIPIKNAEDILAERYAKGELTREQYMQMKEDLKKVQ